MPTASTELLTIPSDFPSSSTQVYRIWLMTDSADPPGQKGDVSLCLHGALGSVWLQQLQTMTPSAQGAATVYGCKIDKDGRPAGGGGKCELYVSAQDVGTLHKVTVAYGFGQDKDKGSQPWKVAQVIVRHGGDGVVVVFPCSSTEMKYPEALLEVMPRLAYHEDTFGNVSAAAPPLPPFGQWHWPVGARFDIALKPGDHDDLARQSEQEAFQIKLYNELLTHELLPLAEQCVHDVTLMRTPGSFLYGVSQSAQGTVHSGSEAAYGTMEQLRKYNTALQKKVDKLEGKKGVDEGRKISDLEVAHKKLHRLEAENLAFKEELKTSKAELYESEERLRQGGESKSTSCVVS